MWQTFLRNWLWGAVTSAAKGAATGGQKKSDSAAKPCDVGVVFALSQEAGCFVDRLSRVTTTRGHGFVARDGWLRDKRIVVVEAGAGQAAAARATDALIVAHHPRLVISAGFAGGLQAGIERGHIVMADGVLIESGDRLTIDLRLDRSAQPSLHIGPLLTVDRIIRTSAEKHTLHGRSGAVAVDMESFAVAQTCRTLGTPFVAIRIVSDGVDDQLPREVDALVRKKSVAGRLGVAFAAITRRPSTMKDLWKLKQTALVHSERLAKFLASLIGQLPSSPT
jgi:adenosylhomocysteine nucleosidase